jgi:hypothetical protein
VKKENVPSDPDENIAISGLSLVFAMIIQTCSSIEFSAKRLWK